MKRIAHNTAILLGVNLSSAVFGLLISVAIGRALGSDGLGRYSLVMAWTFALGIFAEFGLNTLITRDVARNRERADQYLASSSIVKIALSLVLIAVLAAFAQTLTQDNETVFALRFGAILILLNALYGSFTAIFRAFERMTPILVLNSGGLVIQLVGTILLIADHQRVIPLVALAVVVQGLQLVGAFAVYRVAFPHGSKNSAEPLLIAQILRAAAPFAIAGIVGAVELRANFVLLGMLQDERSVGLYSAASRFSEAAKFLPNAFFGAVFPALAAMGANAEDHFRRARRAIFLFAACVAVILSIFAQPILALTFGSAFENAQTTLVVLAWSLVPALVNGLTLLFLYARGDESFANKALALSLLFQLAVTIPLIRLFGAPGAAFGALFGDVALFVLLTHNLLFTFYSLLKRFAIPILIFSFAVLLRAWLIHQTQFDGLYGQDPYAYLDYANALKASLARGGLPPPFFWPLGYPVLIALASTFFSTTIAAQAVSVIASGLAAVMVHFITREILLDKPNRDAASAIAALIFASAGQMMVSSVSAMSDAAGVFWATLAAFALIRSRRDPRYRWVALSAFALGWAVMTRWVYGLLIPVWILAPFPLSLLRGGLVASHHASRRFRPDSHFSRVMTCEGWGLRTLRINLLIALGFFLLALSPQLALMLYYAALGIVSNTGDLQAVSWNLTNALQSNITNGDGRFIYSLPIAAFYSQPFAHPSFIFPLLTPFLFVGAWSLRRDQFAFTLLLGWITVVWFFLAGIAWENPRFSLAFFPPLAVLLGLGLNAAAIALPRFEKFAWACAIVGLALTLGWGMRAADNFVAQQRPDRALATWTNAQLPSDSTVIAFGITETLKHRTPFRVVEIYNESPESLKRILENQGPIFLLLNTENLDSQWKNMTPEVNFRSIQLDSNLSVVATQDRYTLFAVHPTP